MMCHDLSKKATVVLFAILLIICFQCGYKEEKSKPNVLFIAVDDLTSTLGCYGNQLAKTPNFDRLSEMGVQFNRAYCQLPLCNPTRASVLTGLRPDEIGVYDLDRHFRDEVPDVITLPQLFRKNGWWAGRVGKLYHYNVPAGIGTNGLDDPLSWDEVRNPKGRDTEEEMLITNAEPQKKISAALSWLQADGKDEEQTDGMIANIAIDLIKKNKNRPFFLGVGFFRPHTPYVAPKKYFDVYPIESMKLPYSPPDDRMDIPPAAFAHNNPIPNYGLEDSVCLEAMQAYYASVSFVDTQLGKILDTITEEGLLDNTIIVLWSDHGYHLGEHNGVWQKRTLFEESASAPLIIYNPLAAGNGVKRDQIVEYVDIYPTIAELCNLPIPGKQDGRSLVPLLQNPKQKWHGTAFTQILRPGNGNPFMGRSIRTDRWRYTDWDEGKLGEELYDHEADANEFKNLAKDPQYKEVILELRSILDTKVSGSVPQSPFNAKRL
jgi:iduronate 2-sulfatase